MHLHFGLDTLKDKSAILQELRLWMTMLFQN